MSTSHDPMAMALVRYQIIAPYLAADPPRGQRGPLLRQLASKTWTGPDGEPFSVEAETLRTWLRKYRKRGLDGLKDGPRGRGGVQILSEEQQELVRKLKREVPERSLERIIEIAEEMELAPRGLLKRSTVHRVLQKAGISARGARTPDRKDLDRFEADFPGALWQSDMLHGPWLEDPSRPGKMKRAKLFAFLDDHSRLLLAGRFAFAESLPHLELVFRDAMRAWGVPVKVYYDNGAVYRSRHMRQVVAELGIHRIIFTQPYRPMGHGKVEAFNRHVRGSFLSELKASKVRTLDALNEAFVAWAELYNSRPHGETDEAPRARYQRGLHRLRFVDEGTLRQAFLWKEERTADKAGVLSLMGVRYQVSAPLAGRRVQLRFDPENLDAVEVWNGGAFAERLKPLSIEAHRRPRDPGLKQEQAESSADPAADWLAHIVQQRRERVGAHPSMKELAQQRAQQRREQDDAVLALLKEHLDPDVVDEDEVRSWLDRFGPLKPARVEAELLARVAAGARSDVHVRELLDALKGGAA